LTLIKDCKEALLFRNFRHELILVNIIATSA